MQQGGPTQPLVVAVARHVVQHLEGVVEIVLMHQLRHVALWLMLSVLELKIGYKGSKSNFWPL